MITFAFVQLLQFSFSEVIKQLKSDVGEDKNYHNKYQCFLVWWISFCTVLGLRIFLQTINWMYSNYVWLEPCFLPGKSQWHQIFLFNFWQASALKFRFDLCFWDRIFTCLSSRQWLPVPAGSLTKNSVIGSIEIYGFWQWKLQGQRIILHME